MKAQIPCECQVALFEALSEYYGEKITTEVKKDVCCTILEHNGQQIHSVPVILMYLQRYFCNLTQEQEQGIYYAHGLFEKFHMLMNLVENPKESQPKLFQHALDEVMNFIKCMNDNIMAYSTFLLGNKKQVQDIYLGFLLKNVYKHAVTEQKAKELQNLTRYLHTVQTEVVFAEHELKFTPFKK